VSTRAGFGFDFGRKRPSNVTLAQLKADSLSNRAYRMTELLIIKPSSLGDIVHGLQVATTLKAQCKDCLLYTSDAADEMD
jgi:hypothetical protein